jgi:hypothetical protein
MTQPTKLQTPPQAASKPARLLTLTVIRRDGILDLVGLTLADRELFARLAVRTEAIAWAELLSRACDEGIAVLIRSDLPTIQ